MAKSVSSTRKINLTPRPAVLPTLGEINLDIWQCLAEFIDNSVDSFLMAKNAGVPVEDPTINIVLPNKSPRSDGSILIFDNGPGLRQSEIIEVARAGYSSRSGESIYLGLWGMGMNVASARLGKKMEIISLTENGEANALVVDLGEMLKNNDFNASMRDPTPNEKSLLSNGCGTLVRVSDIKPMMSEILMDKEKRESIKNSLGRVYSTMLISGDPIRLSIKINDNLVPGYAHSRWRQEDAPKGSSVYIEIPPSTKEFNIRGWIGVQRYSGDTEYGIDFVRNGRKIEMKNKDLFFRNEDGELRREYPTDDPRNKGRIVGEIHLDQCAVPFAKDRFHRTDPVWEKMLTIVRGGEDFPLGRIMAKKQKGVFNESPLAKIYNGFRRSSPSKATDFDDWLKILSFPNTSSAIKNRILAASPQACYNLLVQEVGSYTKSEIKRKENKRTKTEKKVNSYGRKHFKDLYDPNFSCGHLFISGLIEDIGALNAQKSSIACGICLRALVEVTLKEKINKIAKKEIARSLLIKGAPGNEYQVGLGILLDNMKKHYGQKKNIFGDVELDSVAKAFAYKSTNFASFLNSVTHGSIILGEIQADSFAKECSMLVVGLLTYKNENK